MAVKTIKDQELEPLRELARAHQAALEQAERTRSALEAEKDRLTGVWQPRFDALNDDQQITPDGEHLELILDGLVALELEEVQSPDSLQEAIDLKGR